ncbi:hypothetical protein DM860_016845 [Cuscuta australis]|uniref:Uncharacterized protein n=1 Tax=Cuscuta australis TaxID=267555 RepID=A0A328CZ63_9ASTE|nr:hypothetical protein DM860_016845 [Cuscuta australis]
MPSPELIIRATTTPCRLAVQIRYCCLESTISSKPNHLCPNSIAGARRSLIHQSSHRPRGGHRIRERDRWGLHAPVVGGVRSRRLNPPLAAGSWSPEGGHRSLLEDNPSSLIAISCVGPRCISIGGGGPGGQLRRPLSLLSRVAGEGRWSWSSLLLFDRGRRRI